MKKYILIFTLISVGSHFTSQTNAQQEMKSDHSIEKSEKWNYILKIKNKGTRSEAWLGVLLKNGELIEGVKNKEVIKTPTGKFMWYGKSDIKDPPFRSRGWLGNLPHGKNAFK